MVVLATLEANICAGGGRAFFGCEMDWSNYPSSNSLALVSAESDDEHNEADLYYWEMDFTT